MNYDANKLTGLISQLNSAKTLLKELKKLTREEFMNDPHKISSAKYNFIVAIEAAIDICNHLISKNSFRVPEDYADSFQVLAENGVFRSDFLTSLINMARFRNRLVHLYWKVDNEQLYTILQHNISDLDVFLNNIATALKKKS